MRLSLALSSLMSVVVVMSSTLVGCTAFISQDLPPEDTFYLMSPADDDSGIPITTAQAACATDTAAFDRLESFIAVHNEALQDRIDLVKLAIRATAKAIKDGGTFDRTITRGNRTLTVEAVAAPDGSATYSLTFTAASGTALKFLSGSMAADHNSGAWTISKPDVADFADVTWTRNGDTLVVTRVVHKSDGDRTSVYTRTGTTVTLAFTGVEHDANATWDRATKSGSVTFTDAQGSSHALCWDHSAGSTDFCSVACPGAAGEGEGEGE